MKNCQSHMKMFSGALEVSNDASARGLNKANTPRGNGFSSEAVACDRRNDVEKSDDDGTKCLPCDIKTHPVWGAGFYIEEEDCRSYRRWSLELEKVENFFGD